MGVEPTAARSARPATDFEDRGAHRDTITPTCHCGPTGAICQLITMTDRAVSLGLLGGARQYAERVHSLPARRASEVLQAP